jgi:RecB family exonuclease
MATNKDQAMKTADVVRVLTEMGIAHHVDLINPSFTIHLESGGMIDRMDLNDDWEVVVIDRKFHKFVSM